MRETSGTRAEPTQAEKGARFRALHATGHPTFVIPNPWDVGTARLLAGLGFESLATTSAGYAFSRGLQDGRVGRDAMLRHAAEIVEATPLPVSADLENGFADEPAVVAETIRRAAAAGLCGGSIEDATGRSDEPLYPMELAAERILAAAEVCRGLAAPFVLTARAENYLAGRPDLRDAIARLQAYQEAGAEVLYAPGLTRREDIETLVRAVDRPVNVVMGLGSSALRVADLAAIGVRRISVGSALARAAFGAFLRAARELRERGSFDFAREAISYAEISALFAR
jgi:2-methylisocitrate lyase-like PEP mutase family enzyme